MRRRRPKGSKTCLCVISYNTHQAVGVDVFLVGLKPLNQDPEHAQIPFKHPNLRREEEGVLNVRVRGGVRREVHSNADHPAGEG